MDDSSLVVERVIENYRGSKGRPLTQKQSAIAALLRERFPTGEWFASADAREACVGAGLLKGANPYDQWAKNVGALAKKGVVVAQGDWLALPSVSS